MSFWVIWPLAKDASRERATDLFEMVTCILQKVGNVRHIPAPSARSCISPSPFATFSALASNRPQKSRPVFRKRLANFKYRGSAPSACTTLDRGGKRCHLLQVSLKFVRFCVLCLPFPPFCPSAHTYAGCRVSFDAVRSSRVLIWTSPLVPFAVMSQVGGPAAKNTCIVFFAPDSSFGHVGHQTLLERYKWHAGTVKL